MDNSRDIRRNLNRSDVINRGSSSSSIANAAFYTHVTNSKTITVDCKRTWKLIPIALPATLKRNRSWEIRERQLANSNLLAKRREAFTNYWQTEKPTIQCNENNFSILSNREENLSSDERKIYSETMKPTVITLDESLNETNITVVDLDSSNENGDGFLDTSDGLSINDSRSPVIADTVECKNSSALQNLQQDTAEVYGNEMPEVDAIRTNGGPDDSASSRVAIKSTTPELLDEKVGNESSLLVQIPRTAITLNLNSYGPLSSKKMYSQARPSPEIRIADSSVSDVENTRYLREKCNYSEIIEDQPSVKRPKIVEDVTCLEGTIIPMLSLTKVPKNFVHPIKITKPRNEYSEKRKCNEQNNKLSDEETIRTAKKSRLRRKFRQFFGNELSVSEFEEEESMIDRFIRKKRRKCNSRISQDSGVCLGELACSEEVSIGQPQKSPIQSKSLEVSLEKYTSLENISLNEKKGNDDGDENLLSMPSLDTSFETDIDENLSENLPDSTNTEEKSIKTEITTADSSNDDKIVTNGKLMILISPVNTESPDAFAPVSLEFDLGCESQISTPTSTTGYLPVSQSNEIMSKNDLTKILHIDFHKNSCDVTMEGQTLNVQQDEETTIIMTESSPSTPESGQNLIIDEDMETCDEITNFKDSEKEIDNINEEKASFSIIDDREKEQEVPMDLCSRTREPEIAEVSTITETKDVVESIRSIRNSVEITGNIANGVEIPQNIANAIEITQNISNGVEFSRNFANGSESYRNIGNGVENTQNITNVIEITQNNLLPPPPAPKFRLLHHRELGSRWCPTPLNNNPILVDTQNFHPPNKPHSPISPFSPILPITPTLPILDPQIQLNPIQQSNSLEYLQQMTTNAFFPILNNLRNFPQQTFVDQPNLISNSPGILSYGCEMIREPEKSMKYIIMNFLIPLHSLIERNKVPNDSRKSAELREKFMVTKRNLWLELGRFCSIMNTNNIDRIIGNIVSFYELIFPPGTRVLNIDRVTEIVKMKHLPFLQPNVDQPTNVICPPISTSSQFRPPPPYPGTSYVSQNSGMYYVPPNFIPQQPLQAHPEPQRAESFGGSGILTDHQLRTFYNQVAIYNDLIKTTAQQLKENSVKPKRKRPPRKKAVPLKDQMKKPAGNKQDTRLVDPLEETIFRVLQESQQICETVNQQETTSRVHPGPTKSPATIHRQETPVIMRTETRKSPETVFRQVTRLTMQPEMRRSPEMIPRQEAPRTLQPETPKNPEMIHEQETLRMQPETQENFKMMNRLAMILGMSPKTAENPKTTYQQESILGMPQETQSIPERINTQETFLRTQQEIQECRNPETIMRSEIIEKTEIFYQTGNGPEVSTNDRTVGIADVLQELDALSTKSVNEKTKIIKSSSNSDCAELPMIPGGSSGCKETISIIIPDIHERSCVDETKESQTKEENFNDKNSNNEDKKVVDESSVVHQIDVITLDDCDSDEGVKTQDPVCTREQQIFSILEVKSISKDVFNSMKGNGNVENEASESNVEDKKKEEIMTPELEWCDRCFRCGKSSLVVCERCYLAFYCSAECHEVHWTEVHHLNCKPVPAEKLAELKSCDRSS